MKKNVILKYSLIVSVFAFFAALIIGIVYQFTEPKISDNKINVENQSIILVAGEKAKTFKRVQEEDYNYVVVYNEDEDQIGYVLKVTKRGYSSDIKMLVGLDQQLNIIGLKILEQTETPGLGSRIEESNFLKQFINKNAEKMDLTKDEGDIDAITGATISSRAVVSGIKEEILKFKKELGLQ